MPKHHKVYLFGGHGVGKTSVINLLIGGSMNQHPSPTIEDIYEVILESDRGNKERVSLFDTGGLDDNSPSVPNHYLATADAAIFVFSVNSMTSFDLAKRLKVEATKIRGNDMPMLIIATKSDLSQQRQVSQTEINISSRDNNDKGNSHQSSKLFRPKKSPPFPSNSSD